MSSYKLESNSVVYFVVDEFFIECLNFRIWPPNFVKSLTKNSTPKLKVEIQFYVDSENFMKKY